jgi:acyl dehydratase
MTTTTPPDVELTDEEARQIEFLRSKIGARLDDPDLRNAYHGQSPFFTETNRDAIAHYAWGIDDLNPLWMDEEYAATSVVGKVVAPPSILFPLAPGGMSGSQFFGLGEMFGEHETWGGAKLRWHKWIPIGTRVSTESYLKDIVVKRSRLSGMLLQMIGVSKYFDQDGELLAESESWIFRKRKYQYGDAVSSIELRHWSREEVDELRREKAAEAPRGADTRYWEDVNEGDTFTLLKGP